MNNDRHRNAALLPAVDSVRARPADHFDGLLRAPRRVANLALRAGLEPAIAAAIAEGVRPHYMPPDIGAAHNFPLEAPQPSHKAAQFRRIAADIY